MCIGINVKYRYYCLILMKLEFSGHILGKNAIISKFVMIRPVGAELLHTDRQSGIVVAVRNFANAPKNSPFCPHSVFTRFVWISEQTAIISLYSIN
jgi:hypothetical protein